MASLPLTLLAGGTELSRLPGQLIDPPQICLVIGSEQVLTQAQIPAEVGIAIDSFPRTPVGSRPNQPSPVLGPETPTIVVCRSDRPLDPQAFDRWLDSVLQKHGSRVLRLLGTVRLAGNERRTHLHGVRSCLIRSQRSGDHDPGQSDPDHGDRSGSGRPTGAESLTALVGHGLPETAIQTSFANCQW